MSGGNNHYSGCSCPWCLHPTGGWTKDDLATPINFLKAARASFTIPNARCPECSAPVFFYRSPHNGRVYFDELGIPWPKHPCMDNGRPPMRNKLSPLAPYSVKEPNWKKDGWFPIAFEIIGAPNNEGLQSIWIKNFQSGFSSHWQSSKIPNTAKDEPAFAKQNPEGKWDIDTPSGKYLAWIFPIDLSRLPARPTWRDALRPRRPNPLDRKSE